MTPRWLYSNLPGGGSALLILLCLIYLLTPPVAAAPPEGRTRGAGFINLLNFQATGSECSDGELKIKAFLATFGVNGPRGVKDPDYADIKAIVDAMEEYPPDFNCVSAAELGQCKTTFDRARPAGTKGAVQYPMEFSMCFDPAGLGTAITRQAKGFWLKSKGSSISNSCLGEKNNSNSIYSLREGGGQQNRDYHVSPCSKRSRVYEDPGLVQPCLPHQNVEIRELLVKTYKNEISQAPPLLQLCVWGLGGRQWRRIQEAPFERPPPDDSDYLKYDSDSGSMNTGKNFQELAKDGSGNWLECRKDGMPSTTIQNAEIFVSPKFMTLNPEDDANHIAL
ncbi:hypothetical protein L873DRAFT_1825956 [Choiromyces venosus 120613-1]|uniref:Uncharacterized protein n=1 Tax=Choiromyces venosus 120613-1 TaxID=1336337 RepID=A0A3N4K2Q8_9PEZI|nr:hypothetical protein L873DRAFT_1825956 [Choiromyces venosus 120613-1]